MRSPAGEGLAIFEAIHPRTKAVLLEGVPFSSVAVFLGDELPPSSLLLERSKEDPSKVCVELLAGGILPLHACFELRAGRHLLGRGTVTRV
jgi:hypothetical protein